MHSFLTKTQPIPIKIKSSIPLPPLPQEVPVQKPTSTHNVAITEAEQLQDIKKVLHDDDLFPPEIPIKETIGKSSLMFPRNQAKDHAAAQMLHAYATEGCPVNCGPDWTREKITKLLHRGLHISSKGREAVIQLRNETKEKIQHGYA